MGRVFVLEGIGWDVIGCFSSCRRGVIRFCLFGIRSLLVSREREEKRGKGNEGGILGFF